MDRNVVMYVLTLYRLYIVLYKLYKLILANAGITYMYGPRVSIQTNQHDNRAHVREQNSNVLLGIKIWEKP